MEHQIPHPSHTSVQQPKALRFVTNYGAPHPKRRRIGAACMTCRKRKTACSGERPSCDTCRQGKLQCAGYASETGGTPGHKRNDSDVGLMKPVQDVEQQTEKRRSRSPSTHAHRTSAAARTPRAAADGRTQTADVDRSQDSLFSGPRNRMPYFRWLGPTAIMPGFKQMVVKVKRSDTEIGRSTDGGSVRSPPAPSTMQDSERKTAVSSNTLAGADLEGRTSLALPFYDTSPMPPSELITHLAKTFFTHLGCNYPFLQRERFMRDLEEKQVDAILVDAVCALSARFSTHSLLTQAGSDVGTAASPAEYGHAFAQRAKVALIDTFACPSVAAAQAALLLAYNEFGEQRDSGLWMYLGISIRLAQDLGLHKLEGLQYVGRDGPTPKMMKHEAFKPTTVTPSTTSSEAIPATSAAKGNEQTTEETVAISETRAVEQERVDTFWAIFFLDRVISSGTGRRGTLRDKDIEISFPSMDETTKDPDWPSPFPALIRIVHLYGRVADLLNSITKPSDVITDTPKRLAAMESQVTAFYQGLKPRLHFDAVNFQYYMKAGEGTNFVLLHFWFHMLIVLLHRPTLFKTFDARILQLFPNSQQLSMSSAKTIADILSYSQLMDAKASLGNPFTTQPIYIAACAFLKETAEQTATSNGVSRATSPSRSIHNTSDSAPSTNGTPSDASKKMLISAVASNDSPRSRPPTSVGVEQRSQLAKHTLLATAASQHYQLCYKALQSLETYWAGTKYILTILDQKFEGVEDPLLYTTEEGESSLEQPRPQPSFTSPGWRRRTSSEANAQASFSSPFWSSRGFGRVPESPGGVDANKAIGWTLTGTMDSSSTNLAWHYASGNSHDPNLDPRVLGTSQQESASGAKTAQYAKETRTEPTSPRKLSERQRLGKSAVQALKPSEAAVQNGLSMGFDSSFDRQSNSQSLGNPTVSNYLQPSMQPPSTAGGMSGTLQPSYASPGTFLDNGGQSGGVSMNFLPGDMMIESQDVDMSMLGLDMMPWFDSFPTHDMMSNEFGYEADNSTHGGAEHPGNGSSERQAP
ncbi:unnamed protein product [Zymoseptoria tritici ST99CH_3D1]|nr:unnamed protein product [Zymoseptoria tritici ST99CH_3D1]